MIVLTEAHRAAIARHGESAHPEECCGLMLGTFAEGGQKVVADLLPITNAREDGARHNRFLIGPQEMLRGERQARALGLDLVGIYHSHPDCPAVPSQFDLDHAWPVFSYIIVSVAATGAGALLSWELREDRSGFDAESIDVRTSGDVAATSSGRPDASRGTLMDPVDLLAIGAHPDDIEIGMGGTVARHVGDGFRVGLCDLTAGEMGTNGTIEQRLAEGQAAASVLGAAWRVNLRLPDRGFGSAEHIRTVASHIRKARPTAVAVPYGVDRHPDHVAANALLVEAVFNAGLRRYDAEGEPWRPAWVCAYFINDSAPASFVVDVTAHYEAKRRALDCYQSQFQPSDASAAATRLTAPTFRQLIESRDAQFGAVAGVACAEGFVVRDPLIRTHLFRGEATLPRTRP